MTIFEEHSRHSRNARALTLYFANITGFSASALVGGALFANPILWLFPIGVAAFSLNFSLNACKKNPDFEFKNNKAQQTRLSVTRDLSVGAMIALSVTAGYAVGGSLTAGHALAMALAVGPLGWIALGTVAIGAYALQEAASRKKEDLDKKLFNYNAGAHNRVTNGFYNFFSSIGKVAGFYTPSVTSSPSPS